MSRGLFLSLDGVDGAGKSTQIERLARWLGERSHEVVTCRDPGGTELGEQIRGILLDGPSHAISRRAEMLLYMASRAQLVDEVIEPALAAGKTVISDRFLLANVVYQGYGGELDVEALWQVGAVATGGLMPDLTIVLDLDPAAAQARRTAPPDRLEREPDDFHRRVREGFLTEAKRRPDAIRVVDATASPDEVELHIRREVEAFLRR